MKKIVYLIFIFGLFLTKVNAQDIADVSAKARFERSKQIYLSAGVGFAGGGLGDYGSGTSFETGFMKRLNKVMSIGAGISYMSFKYDASKTYPNYFDTQDDQAIQLTLQGGDVSLLSVGFNFKLNLIPVSDNSKFSIYAIGTPFISHYRRGDVSGNGDFYDYNSSTDQYDIYARNDAWDKDQVDANGNAIFPVLAAQSKFTGGVYLGVGIEFFPAKMFSGFLQATYGYTFPISYVSTSSWLHSEDVYEYNGKTYYTDDTNKLANYFNAEFPMAKKGFTALSLKAGIAFNF